jgi:ABC-type lipoprotein release transport system permease subunit
VKLPTNLNPIPVGLVEKTRKIKGVNKVSGVLIAWAFDGEQGNLHPTVIAGVEPWERELGPLKLSQAQGASGNILLKGRYLNDLDVYVVVLDYDFAKFLKADVGSTVILGGQKFTVQGIIQIGREARIAGAQAFMPLRTAQGMLKRGEVVDTVFVRLDSRSDTKRLTQQLRNLYGENASITTSLDFPATIAGLVTFTDMFMFGLLILIIFVALGFSLRSISAAIGERLKELCVMKAVGWLTAHIRNMLLVESLLIAFIGASLGVGLGSLFALSYINSVKLRLPEILVNYPPCASTPAKTELVISSPMQDIVVIMLGTVFILTILSGIASRIVSGNLKKIECAEGMRGGLGEN